jgi:hypothetical protein
MYICIYEYMYICICVYVYKCICVYVCKYLYVYIHIYIYTYMYICICSAIRAGHMFTPCSPLCPARHLFTPVCPDFEEESWEAYTPRSSRIILTMSPFFEEWRMGYLPSPTQSFISDNWFADSVRMNKAEPSTRISLPC